MKTNLWKYWLEILTGTAASFGLIGVIIWMNMTAIALWWAANMWWVFGVAILILSICCARPLWSAYLEISDHLHTRELRKQHVAMLASVTTKLEQGFETVYKNEVHGFEITMHNPFMKGTAKVQEIAAQPQGLLAPVVPQAPVYAEVDPLITDQKLVLCYTQEGPVFGTVEDLLSMCVVGKPGRGKSTALMYYILILLKAGAEVWIWDPHSGLNDLGYGLNYCDDLGDIEQSCPKLHSMLEQRRKLWKEQKQVMHPLLLLVDEMPVIADYENDRLKELKGQKEDLLEYDQFYKPSRLLKKFVLEARKWNCYVILSGQALPAEVLNTLTRDNMSSRIVFESCPMHAKMAGLQKEQIDGLLPSLKGAGPGIAVMDVSRWSTPVLAAIPNTTVDDLRAFIDGGRVIESDPITTRRLDQGENRFQKLFSTRNDEPKDELLSSDTEDSDYAQENDTNEPVEQAQGTSEFRYMLDNIKSEMFEVAYRITGNIDESLKQIGVHTGYRAHARKIIAERGLRK